MELDQHQQNMEGAFGLIGGWMIWRLHSICQDAGSGWELANPDTMEIIVTKKNADLIYDWCRGIQNGVKSGYKIDLGKGGIKKIKEARAIAHKLLVDEAQDPATSIERKIQLVKLTSK